jgi:ribosomal protein S27AE
MPSRNKVDLQKVLASMNTTCPKCGRVIQPAEIRRISFDEMVCPKCGETFQPSRKAPARLTTD